MVKPSRLTVIIGGSYTLIVGIAMVIISSLSMAAYNCTFQDSFPSSPESYFFHLYYFRSRNCDSSVDWTVFGIANTESVNQALQLPDETILVRRTYLMSLTQLIINCLLVVSSLIVLAACLFNLYLISRKISYWILFVPYCLIFHAAIIIDFVVGTYYAVDRLRSISIDGTMSMLEMINRDAARPYISQIDESFRTLAPNVMFFVSTKALVFNIINVFMLLFMAFAGWEVLDGNKMRLKKKSED